MPIYRVLQIRTCRRGDWRSHLFETRTSPGPWRRIDTTEPDAAALIHGLKAAILDHPDLIGESLAFSQGEMVAARHNDKTPQTCREMTQMELF
ncbi:hypothetical protein [Desulfoluna sp.]|uniref:hypothetical protein n=1 Tax=Desulfoluna sp. TaxID=2045199 RepID=UPI0026186C45|nr:hypothetical protein [Desulfoluna sp.]